MQNSKFRHLKNVDTKANPPVSVLFNIFTKILNCDIQILNRRSGKAKTEGTDSNSLS